MKIKIFFIFFCIVSFNTLLQADGNYKIIELKGDIRVRIGMDEEWGKARLGMMLKDLDTIFSGENSRVVLVSDNDLKFTLGSFAILDIADLRKIQERELFLYLMTLKVDKIQTPAEKTKIRVGNVSVVHGDSKQESSQPDQAISGNDWYDYEINGATALLNHEYYPNAIIKFHKIQNRYSTDRDQGKIDFLIGQSFEAMGDSGQAIDSYQSAVEEYANTKTDNSQQPPWITEANDALQNLHNE